MPTERPSRGRSSRFWQGRVQRATGRFFLHHPCVFYQSCLLTKPSNGRLELHDAGIKPSGIESKAEERATSERTTFKPMTIAELSPCQELGTRLWGPMPGSRMELKMSTLGPKQRQVGGSQRHLSFSWGVPSGQVTLGPGREDSHRQREEEGERSGSTLNMRSRPRASEMHKVPRKPFQALQSDPCHCELGTLDRIARVEVGEWKEEDVGRKSLVHTRQEDEVSLCSLLACWPPRALRQLHLPSSRDPLLPCPPHQLPSPGSYLFVNLTLII